MGVIGRALSFQPRASTSASDPRWSAIGGGTQTRSGQVVSADGALKVATVWACVRVLGTTVASLPVYVYRKRSQRGQDLALEHPLSDLLRTAPCAWLTSYQWRYRMMAHLLLRGNDYARIVPGRRGFVDQLVPLHPDWVQPEVSTADGRWLDAATLHTVPVGASIRYRILQGVDGQSSDQVLPGDEVFHMRGMTLNGLVGLSAIRYMRETVGVSLAAQEFGASAWKQGAKLSGVLSHPSKLTPEAKEHLRTSWQQLYGGTANAGKTAVLEEGMKWQGVSMTPEDAQWVESQHFNVEELLRFLGVPGVLVGHADKTATYASSEAFFQAYKTYGVYPWVANFEAQAALQLLLDPRRYSIEMGLDALFRPDAKTRAEVWNILVTLGVLTRNEVREAENWNMLPGLDEPLTPLNLERGSQRDSPAAPASQPAQDSEKDARRRQRRERSQRRRDGADALRARLTAVLRVAAARVIRKELEAVQRWAPRHASDAGAWSAWLARWYGEHRALVSEAMQIDDSQASKWCERQVARLATLVALDDGWVDARVAELVALAGGG